MASPLAANTPSTPPPKARKANTLSELVSSFGLQQSPTSVTHARRSVASSPQSPVKPQFSPSSHFLLTLADQGEDSAAANAGRAGNSIEYSLTRPPPGFCRPHNASIPAPFQRQNHQLDGESLRATVSNGSRATVSTYDVTGSTQEPTKTSKLPIIVHLSDSDSDNYAKRSETAGHAQQLGQASGNATSPIVIDLSDDDASDDDAALSQTHSKVPANIGKSYWSPIYLVSSDEETEADDSTLLDTNIVTTPIYLVDEGSDVDDTGDAHVKQESTVMTTESQTPIKDGETTDEHQTEVQEPCTPTRSFRESPSTPSYLLSFMGEESALSDFRTPGSPSLRRSGRTRNTPKTYSLKKLTNPEAVAPRRTPKIRIDSDLSPSPLRSPCKPLTARKQVRDAIAKVTKVKRDRFLSRYKDLILPLLPENNYIANLESEGGIVEYEEVPEQPAGVTATLKPHQMVGLSFLVHMHKNGMPCILGDEMGLGKTLQTLSLFQWIEEQQQETTAENRPYLVVCPLSVLSSWVSEAQKWTPGLRVITLHGSKAERQHLKKIATSPGKNDDSDEKGDYKIVVTTYETFKAEQSWFKTAFVWRYVVLDEGHTIKNSKTQVARDFQGISPEYRLVLSGTPLQNNLAELWSILHWLLPDVFTSKTGDLFIKSFNIAKGNVNMEVMDRSRDLLELLMLRRLKSSPGIDLGLPPKTEVLLYVPLTPMQRALYLKLITHQGDMFLNEVFADTRTKEQPVAAGGLQPVSPTAVDCETEDEDPADAQNNKGVYQRLMNLVVQLRMCCNHPYLISNVQPDPYELGPEVLQSSGKFIVLEKLLRELILVRKKKVLIFSGFTGMLDLSEDLITMMDAFKPLRIDGSCGRAKRNLNMRLFNDLASDYRAMLISTKAGGLGITLTAATEVIFLDFGWNPQITLQAEARAHRIGQKNPVTVYKLCTQGTVEEQMMGRIDKKLYLSTKITESMKSLHNAVECAVSTGDAPELDSTQLKSLLRRGAQTLTTPAIDVADMSSWDFEQVLSKCRPVDPASADDGNVDEEKWLTRMERVETAVFDGRRIEKEKRTWPDAPILDLEREQRRTGKAMTVDVDGFSVSKQSLDCGDWEAVPTLAGKDPSLAFIKREKRSQIQHQDYCQVCWLGGEMVECTLCPRSYHRKCLDGDFEKTPIRGQYFCLQHRCVDCQSRAPEKGGMLYRCRFCSSAYCEDCVNHDLVDLVDFSLPELEILDYGANDAAFFIKCQSCKNLHFAASDLKAYSEKQMEKWEVTRERRPDCVEREDSMNPLFTSETPCQSPTKRNASPYDPYRPSSAEKSPGSKPSPTKKLRYHN